MTHRILLLGVLVSCGVLVHGSPDAAGARGWLRASLPSDKGYNAATTSFGVRFVHLTSGRAVMSQVLAVTCAAALGYLGLVPPHAADQEPVPECPQILGTWEGQAPNGDRVTYEFRSDSSVMWTVDSPRAPGPVSARYTIDCSVTPARLDISQFSLEPLKGTLFVGIAEFRSPDTMKFEGRPVRLGMDQERPTTFSEQAITFRRTR